MINAESSRAEIRQELQRHRIEQVTANYDGTNDEGFIDEVEFGSMGIPAGVAAAVENLFYCVLEELYAGWENNDGAFGELSWDVKADRIHLIHNTRIEWLCETEERSL